MGTLSKEVPIKFTAAKRQVQNRKADVTDQCFSLA